MVVDTYSPSSLETGTEGPPVWLHHKVRHCLPTETTPLTLTLHKKGKVRGHAMRRTVMCFVFFFSPFLLVPFFLFVFKGGQGITL